jgi:hypothetical protein
VVRIQAALVSSRGRETLWYEVDERYGHGLLTSRLDGFAVAVLPIAMERGEPQLVVNGAISEMLLHNLQRQIVPILRCSRALARVRHAVPRPPRNPAPRGPLHGVQHTPAVAALRSTDGIHGGPGTPVAVTVWWTDWEWPDCVGPKPR